MTLHLDGPCEDEACPFCAWESEDALRASRQKAQKALRAQSLRHAELFATALIGAVMGLVILIVALMDWLGWIGP